MKKIFSILFAILIIATLTIPVFATGNEWVMDESQVLSKETEDYIKTLNEQTFANYKNKPQLAIVVIDSVPTEYSMNEYKLRLFNKYGVGTKEENCGMLFVLAVKSREYGFEIGDGYKQGSLLRRDLSADFVTGEIRAALSAEKWDEAIMLITKHLEKIQADEEAGVYAAKEVELAKEEEEMGAALAKIGSVLFLFLIAIVIIYAVVFISFKIIRYFMTVSKIKKFIAAHPKHIELINLDIETIGQKIMKNIKYFNCGPSQTDDVAMETLHRIYLDHYLDVLKDMVNSGKAINDFTVYEKRLNDVLCLENFINLTLKDIQDIIDSVDEEIEREKEIRKINHNKIYDYVLKHKNEIPKGLIQHETLIDELQKYCEKGVLLSDSTIEYIFDKELKEKAFERDYEAFIKENKGKIDSEYFDKKEFYDTVKHSSYYQDYNYRANNNLIWMMLLLNHHMEDNRRAEQARIERERQESFNHSDSFSSNSSFGTSFGGGFSTGGGFSGRF